MARRDEHHHHHHHPQLHYASILPANVNGNHNHNDPHIARRSSDQERMKPLYVDFEHAFQEETANNDYFDFQSLEPNSNQLANFHLQSVEMISEVKNNNFSPYIRYQASRDTSHPSTPLNPSPYPPEFNHRSNDHPTSYPYFSPTNGYTDLNRDFTNLNLIHSNNYNNDDPAPPFTPDALRVKFKQEPQQQQQQQEIMPNLSSQSKINLPQYFLVKYLGRSLCTQLWGAKAVRTPIDDMVRNARQLSSMNDIPTLEICVSLRGLTLTHRQSSPTRSKHNRNHSSERHQRGLIPLENISYAMHDVKYSKIASCIVLRQAKTTTNDHKNITETLTECYTFLFQSKDYAHKFALALAEAFNIEKQPTRNSKQNHDEKREGRSPQRRSKHRHTAHHHHHRTHNENHSKDSHV